MDTAKATNEKLKNEVKLTTPKPTDDKETQANLSPQIDTKQQDKKGDEDDENFVYQSTEKSQENIKETKEAEEEEEDDDVFVYRGEDAPEQKEVVSNSINENSEQTLESKKSTNGEASQEEKQQAITGIVTSESHESKVCFFFYIEGGVSRTQIYLWTSKLIITKKKTQ